MIPCVLTPEDVRHALQSEVAKNRTQKATAAKFGVSATFFSEVLSGRRDPGKKILAQMNLRRVTRYEFIRETEK